LQTELGPVALHMPGNQLELAAQPVKLLANGLQQRGFRIGRDEGRRHNRFRKIFLKRL
jgi:hypothetical protein